MTLSGDHLAEDDGAAPEAGRGRRLLCGGAPGGLVLAAVHGHAQEEHPPQEAHHEAHAHGQ